MPSGTIIMPSGTIIMPSGTIWPEFLPKLASVAPGAPPPTPRGAAGRKHYPGNWASGPKTGSASGADGGGDLAPRRRAGRRARGARSPSVGSRSSPFLVRTPNFPGNASVPLPPAAAGAPGATLASFGKNSGQMVPDGIIMVPDRILMVPDGINALY